MNNAKLVQVVRQQNRAVIILRDGGQPGNIDLIFHLDPPPQKGQPITELKEYQKAAHQMLSIFVRLMKGQAPKPAPVPKEAA